MSNARHQRLACWVLTAACGAGLALASPPKEVTRTVPLEPTGRVYLDTYKGTVRITTAESREVEIRARIEPDSLLGDDRECVEQTEVRIEASSDAVRIKSDYSRLKGHSLGLLSALFGGCSSLPLVHYTIRMPRAAPLRIKDYKSEMELSDVQGGTEIDTYKGTLSARGLRGALDLKTYKGEVRLEFASWEHAGRVETYKGNIQIRLPRGSKFDLTADLGRHADLDSDFHPAVRERRGKALSGAVNGGGPSLRLKTSRGTIRLRTA